MKIFYKLIQHSLHHSGHQHHATHLSETIKSSTNTTPSSAPGGDRLTIQVFCNLIELMTILFTRIKSHQVLSELLIQFAQPIEMLAELNSISKVATDTLNTSTSGTPVNKKRASTSTANSASSFLLQSNRRSSDLYDTFSMQIASYIQNHLNTVYYLNQFDSELLQSLEPIFFSFLKYSTKQSLKQKTLQAWNSTFGKSTVSSLKYSHRLESLFLEIREEMVHNKSSNSHSQIVISLPGFRPAMENLTTTSTNAIESDEVAQTATKDSNLSDDNITMPSESAEEANNNNNNKNSNNDDNGGGIKLMLSKDSMTNDSSLSVPVAHLVKAPTTPTSIRAAAKPTVAPVVAPEVVNNKPSFVFSPFNEKASSVQINQSQSASKIYQLKTPENSGTHHFHTAQTSPRNLRNNSKRKLDLNGLIDQMPNDEFVLIKNSPPKVPATADNSTQSQKSVKSSQSTQSANESGLFKQPLTEHQKEMRKKKSFIPFEMHSLCSEIEADSQMSMTQDDDSNSVALIDAKKSNPSQQQPLTFSAISEPSKSGFSLFSKTLTFFKSPKFGRTATTPTQESESAVKVESRPKTPDVEKREEASGTTPIRFQSKINPKKQIELVRETASTGLTNQPFTHIQQQQHQQQKPSVEKSEAEKSVYDFDEHIIMTSDSSNSCDTAVKPIEKVDEVVPEVKKPLEIKEEEKTCLLYTSRRG